jgi:hypothetical protein
MALKISAAKKAASSAMNSRELAKNNGEESNQ